ncbi:MAG: hypothetical protein PHP76_03055 [Bacteroidales bacterium]|nr:hypothetical protein [Bacteroidales bacterium]
MAKFIGEYKAKIDDKGRLIFPSAFKSLMGEGADLRFVVKKSLFAECLEMYTYSEWEKDSDEVKSRLNFFNKEHTIFWREYMRGSAIIEPDEKLSRMLIPKPLLEAIGVEKDVVFCGSNYKIEIWAKEKYEAQRLESDDFVSLAEKILG